MRIYMGEKNTEPLTREQIRDLIRQAIEARKMAYTPYSHYDVGAALLAADGRIYRGCNIENAAYTPTNCAERTAFFKAVSEGCLAFRAIAVVGSPKGEAITQYGFPCGVCRQVMMEFCDPDSFEVIVALSPDEYRSYRLREILPEGFGPVNLQK